MADSPDLRPYDQLGGSANVRALAERFYEIMATEEPALARLHPCEADGRIKTENRERFALFLIGWLGGPDDYERQHGHPRLRMRHMRVPVDVAMRDAWLRCMVKAMDDCGVTGPTRLFLESRFADVANFLRNVPERSVAPA